MAFLFISHWTMAQTYDSYAHQGEYGVGIGLNHYLGDLNPLDHIDHPNLTVGAFYLHNFNNYIGIKFMANYVKMGYADAYTDRPLYKRRNLSFNSDNIEATVNAQFNFFHFLPGFPGHEFTPYLAVGIGILNYNPYTYIGVNNQQEKVYLRPLGTEGQKSTTPHDGKKYGSIAAVFPISMGLKYALTEKINIFGEIGYRFTTTDYLDDVSTTYAGAQAFEAPNYQGNAQAQWYAQQLQDRSNANTPGSYVGSMGAQRGSSTAKDGYIVGLIGISFNINGYICPTSK